MSSSADGIHAILASTTGGLDRAGPLLTYAPCVAPLPLKGFGPLVKIHFCLKMSENHAEIAGNQVKNFKNTNVFWKGDFSFSP